MVLFVFSFLFLVFVQVLCRLWVGTVARGAPGGVPLEEKVPVQNREGAGRGMGPGKLWVPHISSQRHSHSHDLYGVLSHRPHDSLLRPHVLRHWLRCSSQPGQPSHSSSRLFTEGILQPDSWVSTMSCNTGVQIFSKCIIFYSLSNKTMKIYCGFRHWKRVRQTTRMSCGRCSSGGAVLQYSNILKRCFKFFFQTKCWTLVVNLDSEGLCTRLALGDLHTSPYGTTQFCTVNLW